MLININYTCYYKGVIGINYLSKPKLSCRYSISY